MNKKEVPFNEKREERIRGLVYAFSFLVVFFILIAAIYMYNHDISHQEFLDSQISELDTMESLIQNNMHTAISPLLIFNRSESAKKILIEKDYLRSEIFNDIFLSLIQEIRIYQQIRLIDNKGMEIVRVDNHNNGVFEIVSDDKLQDKSNRYYFIETLETPSDSIYISPFDLNVENDVIEIPYKPMIRLGKTYNIEGEKPSGMMILNVLGQSLLDDISEQNIHDNDKVFLLNKEGYYIYSEDYDKNFAFMFPDKTNIGFFDDYKSVWERILNGDEIIESEYGNFYTRKISLIDEKLYKTNDSSFYLIMFVPSDAIHSWDSNLNKSIVISSVLFGPLIFIIGLYLGSTRTRNIFYKIQLERNASHDSLTGLYNHRMIISLLNQMIGLSRRKNEELSIVFADVNNLKYVNDSFGHKMGDKMIIGVADSLSKSVRSTDLVSRLGGDEFLVVFPDCNELNANLIMERASESFKDIGIEEMNMPWIMSYGCVKLKESENINEFISRADKLMYENKRISKLNK